jgi:hypothetical protein
VLRPKEKAERLGSADGNEVDGFSGLRDSEAESAIDPKLERVEFLSCWRKCFQSNLLRESLSTDHWFSNRLWGGIQFRVCRLRLLANCWFLADGLRDMNFVTKLRHGLKEGLECHYNPFELFPATLEFVILRINVLQLVVGTFKSSEVV